MKLSLPNSPPEVSARAVRRAWTAVVALVILVVIGMAIGVVWVSSENQALTNRVERSDEEIAELNKTANEDRAASQALAEQVKRLGAKPVVEPGEPDPGPPLILTPTDEQADAAVAEWCSVGSRCKPTVSRADVRAALTDICATGACDAPPAKDGKDGRDGQDGTDGADSTVPGPGMTDEQADAAVARYCAANTCGEDGQDGKDGQDGQDGAPGSVTPGDYACPDGEYVTKIAVTAEGSMVLSCARPSLLDRP